MTGLLDEIKLFEDTMLRCPRCGEYGGMHHNEVTVYQRGEDAAMTQVVRAGTMAGTRRYDPVISVRHEPSEKCGNPSSRRDAVAITFDCEMCGDEFSFELCIAQHKGSTYLTWRGDLL